MPEQQLRRRAQDLGLAVKKSRRDGTYMVVDPFLNALVYGDREQGYGLGLDEVEISLNEEEASMEALHVKA